MVLASGDILQFVAVWWVKNPECVFVEGYTLDGLNGIFKENGQKTPDHDKKGKNWLE
ncbi:hypothetical protein GACE_1201 [Geoglobus acetivorans]|uniref:Uncharacterized protein n=1 Tax=Geoglobus acetivorans TaxID=565033 RepID=A0A0A7GDW7_GEOAI|nr:hypothetical protein GACE_1201 [Geoglobus acetivorans]